MLAFIGSVVFGWLRTGWRSLGCSDCHPSAEGRVLNWEDYRPLPNQIESKRLFANSILDHLTLIGGMSLCRRAQKGASRY